MLITTFTNRALDNIIERTLERGKIEPDLMIREGNKYSMSEAAQKISYTKTDIEDIKGYSTLFEKKKVWFVTLSSLFIHHIPKQFDVVIVDEASQCLEPMCLQAIQRGTKFILIGDYKQLEPVVRQEDAIK